MSESFRSDEHEPPPSGNGNLLPAHTSAEDQTSGADEHGRKAPRHSTWEEILAKLDHLAGAVAMGYLTPAQANAMRSAYVAMLSAMKHSSPNGSATIADADAITILREHPEMLPMIAPFLTSEQLELVSREAGK
jgi:hypothetical protein